MAVVRRPAWALLAILLLPGSLASGCAEQTPVVAGVWSPDDDSGLKTIAEDGTCSGMYYHRGEPLDIGGAATCTLSEGETDGSYTLVVQQPPNQSSYQATFDGDDTMLVDTGPRTITMTRQ